MTIINSNRNRLKKFSLSDLLEKKLNKTPRPAFQYDYFGNIICKGDIVLATDCYTPHFEKLEVLEVKKKTILCQSAPGSKYFMKGLYNPAKVVLIQENSETAS